MSENEKRDKVMKGMDTFLGDKCTMFTCDCYVLDCPYAGKDCMNEIIRDAHDVMKAQEPRLMTASDFEDNPDVDSGGFLPCWIECNGIEVERAISLGVIQEGETLDGWTEVSMAELIPTDPSYNPNVRHWTARPSEEQRSATPW